MLGCHIDENMLTRARETVSMADERHDLVLYKHSPNRWSWCFAVVVFLMLTIIAVPPVFLGAWSFHPVHLDYSEAATGDHRIQNLTVDGSHENQDLAVNSNLQDWGDTPSTDESVVVTRQGSYRGEIRDEVIVFHGVPFAKPPVGRLRWRPPIMVARRRREDVYDALKAKPGCMQSLEECSWIEFLCPKNISEDCLNLDIYKPRVNDGDDLLPVNVIIHGGSLQRESGNSAGLSPAVLVNSTGVITVLPEYRLGALGFLYTGDGSDDAPGNLGLLDQRMALTWIKKNIRYFGGDPQRVTLMGHSAGAQSVLLHTSQTRAARLFHRAVLLSPPALLPYLRPLQARAKLATPLAEALDCHTDSTIDMACLRDRSAEDVIEAQVRLKPDLSFLFLVEPFSPVIDGRIVKHQLLEAFQNYSRNNMIDKIPMLWGTTSDEGVPFVYKLMKIMVPSFLYDLALGKVFPHEKDRKLVRKQYPPSSYFDIRPTISQMVTDFLFRCPRRSVLGLIPRTPGMHSWAYTFSRKVDFTISGLPACFHKACHGTDLLYILQNWNLSAIHDTPKQKDFRISDTIKQYIANFIKYGNPNGGSAYATNTSTSEASQEQNGVTQPEESHDVMLTQWPPVDGPGGAVHIDFDNVGAVRAVREAGDARCDMWATVNSDAFSKLLTLSV